MADSNTWLPAATAAVTGGCVIISSWLTGWMATLRESRLKVSELEESRKRRSEDFQRKTLLRLQLALYNHGRSIGETYHLDLMTARKTGVWGNKLPDDVDQRAFKNKIALALLKERLLDDELRIMLDELNELESFQILPRPNSRLSVG